MNVYHRLVTRLAVLGILMAAGIGVASASGWTTFTDPTENAFTLEVPAGWRVKGGIERFSPTNAQAWVAATTPDRATFIFLGDPSVPIFEVPNPPMMIRAGTWITSAVSGLAAVVPYQPGAQFAALYGKHALGKMCGHPRLRSTAARPDLARHLWPKITKGFQVPGEQVDAGIAMFDCVIGGKPATAAVVAATVLVPLPSGGGVWYVPALYGFRTPRGQEAASERTAQTMQKSFKNNPQWLATITRAIRQRGAAARQQAQRQAERFSAQLRQEGQDLANTMQRSHATYMAMMGQQEADRNNAFNNHMRQKAWGQFNQMLYINNEYCIWNTSHTVCTKVHD